MLLLPLLCVCDSSPLQRGRGCVGSCKGHNAAQLLRLLLLLHLGVAIAVAAPVPMGLWVTIPAAAAAIAWHMAAAQRWLRHV
jgi:hypothetical protein